jgi:hypothetical protein
VARAAEDLDFSVEQVRAAFVRVCERLGWRFDASARWLLTPEALIVVWDGSEAQLIGYRRELVRQAPPSELLERFDALSASLRETSPETTGGTSPLPPPLPPRDHGGQEQEQEQERTETPSASAFVDSWNRITQEPIPRCRDLAAKRKRHVQARLKDRTLPEWEAIMAKIQGSSFCRGANDRRWTASFDGLIESPDVGVKALEGKYDDRPSRRVTTVEATGRRVESAEETDAYLKKLRADRDAVKAEGGGPVKFDRNQIFTGGAHG